MKLRDEIMAIIRETKQTAAPVLEASNLYTDLGFDSFAFVQLLAGIEETYSILIGLMEMETCLEVYQLIALVEHKVKEAGHDSTLADESGKL